MSGSNATIVDDDLLPEYDLDFSKSKSNPFAESVQTDARYVPLDPDVAAFYSSTAELNEVLRAMIPLLRKRDAAVEQAEPVKV